MGESNLLPDILSEAFLTEHERDLVNIVSGPLLQEISHARHKHGPGNTPQNAEMPTWKKLAILVEEVGEVAEALQDEKAKSLERELMQVAAMALLWYASLR